MTTMSMTTPSCQMSKWRTARNLRCPVVLGIAVLAVLFSAAAVQESRNLHSLTDPIVWLQWLGETRLTLAFHPRPTNCSPSPPKSFPFGRAILSGRITCPPIFNERSWGL